MATINQSPAGQSSVSLSAIRFSSLAGTGTPQRRRRTLVGSPSVAASFGSGGGGSGGGPPLAPSTGQIHPSGR